MRTTLVLSLLLACGSPAPPVDTAGLTTTPCTPLAWFADADDDGWGDASALTVSCEPVLNAVTQVGDCDDSDPLVHPDAPDDCTGRDDDCDGVPDSDAALQPWYADQDGDGVGGSATVMACAQPPGFTQWPGDCDDGDAEVFPTAPERCNGIDDDCDGTVPTTEVDLDGDGFAPCAGDCEDADPNRHPGRAEVCNGADDDCDGVIPLDEFDLDGDSQSPCAGDCDDANALVFLGGIEITADGADTDCDGTELCFQDADGDGEGSTQTVISADLACDGPNEADNATDCDDLDPLVAGGAPEVPHDGVDNDCDPATPDDDIDGDGFGVSVDCDDFDPGVHPGVVPSQSFVDITVDAGMWQTHWDAAVNPPACGSEGMSGGVSVADFDNDGLLDVYLPRMHEPNRLFRNLGNGMFTDVAAAAGVDHVGTTSLGLWFDMDGDGDQDLFLVSAGMEGNRLYANDGDGTFTEQPGANGMEQPLGPGVLCSLLFNASAADVDGDGDLDVHTTQWHGGPLGTGDRSRLFLNDGLGNFTDGTVASGLDLFDRAGFVSTFGDLDDDGDQDLALAADWGQSGLWLNDGLGSFTEVTGTAGVGLDENGMGSDLGDYDGDGDLDWFVTAIYDTTTPCPANWDCAGNFLYQNNGDGSFSDVTDAAGVRDGRWGWGAMFLDVDNDGDLDLAHTNGFHIAPQWAQDPVRLYVNDGTGVFADKACEYGADVQGQGKGLVAFDADNDGDLDLLTTLTDAEPRLLRNDGGDAGSWVRVHPSEPGNAFGVGARVELTAVAGGPTQRIDVDANSTYGGQGPAEAHFGLADHEVAVAEIRVTWPDGGVTVLTDVAPRQQVWVAR